MAIRRLGLSHVAIVIVMLIAGLLLTHQSVEAQSTSTLRFVCANKLGQLLVVGNSNSCPIGYYRFLLGPTNPALTVCLTPPSNTARLNFPVPCLWFEQTAIIHGPTEMFACTDRPLNRLFIQWLRIVASSTDCPPGDYALRIPPSNPQAANDNYVTAFETPLTVPPPGVLANDAINSGSVTSYDAVSANGGVVTVNPDGSFSYSPPAGFVGTDSFGYTVSNSAGASSATVTIQVMYLPEAVDDAFTLGGSGTIDAPGVLSNDTPNGGTITAYDSTTTAGGTVTLNSNGSFTYAAPATLPITDTFTYTLANPAGSSMATVTLTLNQAPTATDDSYSVNEDVVLTVPPTGVLANDSDPDLNPLTANLVTGPNNGTLTLNPDGSFVYSPDANFNGSDTFTYQANDGFTNSNVATVTITVDPANDGPTASDQSVTTNEDIATDITLTGSDIDGDTLTFTIGTAPTNGSLGAIGPVTCAAGSCSATVTYTPALNFNGADSFTFTVSDGIATSAPATISITVNAVNDAPVANDDAVTVAEDGVLNVSAPGVLANDTDAESDPLTAAVVADPSNGSLTLNANGSFTYTPDADFNGTDSFTYQANDGQANSNTATVTITVTAANDAPIANTQSVTTNEDTAITITLTGNDIDGDSLTFSIGTGPTNGLLGAIDAPLCVAGSCSADVLYTPSSNYSGVDSFTFTVSDGTATSVPATVNITVDPVNDPPVANDDSYNADGVTPLIVNAPGVLGNDTDIESNPLTAVLVTGPTGGTLTLDSNGSFTYTANSGTTSDSFTYQANDGTSNSNIATVTISVNAVPVADDQSVTTAEDAPITITLTASDADDENLTFAIGTAPTLGSLGPLGAVDCSATNDCSVTVLYTPNANANGSDSFTFTVNDGNGNSLPGTVSITITPVNDPPSFTAPNPPASLEDAGLQTVLGWVTSVSTGPANESGQTILGYTVSNIVPSATMSFTTPPAVAADGTLTYQAAPNAYGSATFDVVVQDSGGGTDTSSPQSFTITVTPVNDAPTFTAGGDVTVLEDAGPQTVNPWATSISVGPNETGQTLTFAVTNDNNSLFSAQPAVSSTGTLTFTPALNMNGTATVSVTLSDDGGTANGGDETSATATFTITVTPVNDAPTALPKTYSAQSNMPVTIDGTTQGGGLLAGATDPDASDPGFTSVLTVGTVSATTPAGGTVTVTSTTGAFTFTPPPGVTGNVTFTYEVCDNGNPNPPSLCSTPQTVTINVLGPAIWFVDPNAASNGNGTLGNPFNSLTAAAAVDAAGHRIFLYSGTANAGITLEANEWLIGQGATNDPATFDALFGINPPAGTASRPTIGGTRPSINFTGGTAVALSTNNRLQGFNISSQTGITGADVDGLLVSQISVTSTNGSALSIAGGTSAMNVALDSVVANSGSQPGVRAVNNGMGSLLITGETNTITSTTGVALEVTNTTIASGGLKFRSISANGAASGIVLNTTGTTAGLTVTGNSGTCSLAATCTGGAIQNTAGDGVSLTNTRSVSLTRLYVGSTGGHGINTSAVNGLTLTAAYIQNAGNGDNEHGLHLVNVQGTVTIDGTTFNNAAEDLIHLANNVNATINVVNGSRFEYPTTVGAFANSAMLFLPGGSSSLTVSIMGATFSNVSNAAAQIGADQTGSNGTQSFTFSNNTINVTTGGRASGVVISGQESTTTNLTIATNTFNGAGGNGVISIDTNDASTVLGSVTGNTINNPPAVGIFNAVDEDATSRITFDNNLIVNSGGEGIQVVNFGGAGVSTLCAVITNNTVNGHNLDADQAFWGAISITSFEDNTCAAVRGNTVSGTPADPTRCGGAPCVDVFIEEVGGTTQIEEIPNTGATTATDDYIRSINPGISQVDGSVTVFGNIDLTNGTLCPLN